MTVYVLYGCSGTVQSYYFANHAWFDLMCLFLSDYNEILSFSNNLQYFLYSSNILLFLVVYCIWWFCFVSYCYNPIWVIKYIVKNWLMLLSLHTFMVKVKKITLGSYGKSHCRKQTLFTGLGMFASFKNYCF